MSKKFGKINKYIEIYREIKHFFQKSQMDQQIKKKCERSSEKLK